MSRFFRYGLTLLGIVSCIFIYSIQNQNATAAISGCTDPAAINYDPSATIDDGSCSYPPPPPPAVLGCMNPAATNYNPAATVDDGSCIIAPPPPPPVLGCMNPAATNYNPAATTDDGSCIVAPPPPPVISGCTNSGATNYNSGATLDDGSCIMPTPTPTPTGGGGGGGGGGNAVTTTITSTNIIYTQSGKVEPNYKIVEKPCEITNYTGHISQVYLATNTGETIRKRSPIDFTKMEGNCEGKNITPKVIKYPFNSFVARGDEWKTNRFPEDFYTYLTQNGGGVTVNQTKYIFTYSGKTLNNTDVSTNTTKNKYSKSTPTTKKTNSNKEIILGADPIENLKPFHDITFKNPIRIYCTNIKEYSSRFPILDTYHKEHCSSISTGSTASGSTASGSTASGSTASGSTASIETCDVTEYKFSNNSQSYLSNNLKYVRLSTNFSYKFKKNECKGKEKIVDTIKFTGCPKNLGELDQSVKNYVEMKGCGNEIHQDVYIIGDTNILGSSIDVYNEIIKLPMSTVKLNKVNITCANAADFASKYPEAKNLLESTECKKNSTVTSPSSVTNYAQASVRPTVYSLTNNCPNLNDILKNLLQNTSIQLNSSGVSCTPVDLPSVNSGSTATGTTSTGSTTTPSKKTPVKTKTYCDGTNTDKSDCIIS